MYETKQKELEMTNYGKETFGNKVDFYKDIISHGFDSITFSNHIQAAEDGKSRYSVLCRANVNSVLLSENQKVLRFENRTKKELNADMVICDDFRATKYYATKNSDKSFGYEVYYFLEIENCPVTVPLFCYKDSGTPTAS